MQPFFCWAIKELLFSHISAWPEIQAKMHNNVWVCFAKYYSGKTKRFQRSSLEISFSELHSFLVVRPRPLRYLPNPFPELCGNVRSYTSEGYTFYDNRHKNIVRWLFYKIILVIYIFNLLIIKVYSHVDVIVKISIEF